MLIQIITPEQRLADHRGVSILVAGPYGIGKTSQVRTLDPATTLFVRVEDGDLAIRDVPVPQIKIRTWPNICDLAVRIAGPNPAYGSNERYSDAHFTRVGGLLPGSERYRTIFLDSLTETSRLCFRDASLQPEAFSDRTGKADLRSVYGLHARELLLFVRQLQSASGVNIIMTCALETITDDYGRITHGLQMEGQRAPREIPGIIDVIVTMNSIDFGDAKPIRVFICTSPNAWNFPAKDRSGKLDQIEKPDLGALIAKILPSQANHGREVEGEQS